MLVNQGDVQRKVIKLTAKLFAPQPTSRLMACAERNRGEERIRERNQGAGGVGFVAWRAISAQRICVELTKIQLQ